MSTVYSAVFYYTAHRSSQLSVKLFNKQLQVPGQNYKFLDKITSSWTKLQVPGHDYKFLDTIASSWTQLKVPGHNYKFLDTIKNCKFMDKIKSSWTQLQDLGRYISGNVPQYPCRCIDMDAESVTTQTL